MLNWQASATLRRKELTLEATPPANTLPPAVLNPPLGSTTG
jgi:hypothetical protein